MNPLGIKAMEIGRPLNLTSAEEFIDDDIDIAEVAANYGDIMASIANLEEKPDDQDGENAGFEAAVTRKIC